MNEELSATPERQAADSSAAPTKGRLLWWMRIAVSMAALVLLFVLLPADAILDGINAVPPAVWPIAIVAYLACHLVGVVKWRLLVNAAGAGLGARDAVRAYYWGLFGNLFLPSIVGGDVVRAGAAMRRVRSRSGLIFGSLVDRVQDVVGLLVLVSVGAVLGTRSLEAGALRVLLSIGLALLLGAVVIATIVMAFRARWLSFRWRRLLVRVRRAVRATAERPRALVMAFTLGIGLQTALVLLNQWLGHFVGVDAAFAVWLAVWPLSKLAGLLPVTQGGIGVREAALAGLFAPFGVPAAKAVATGLVFEVVLIGGGLLSGLTAYLAGHWREDGPAATMLPLKRS